MKIINKNQELDQMLIKLKNFFSFYLHRNLGDRCDSFYRKKVGYKAIK